MGRVVSAGTVLSPPPVGGLCCVRLLPSVPGCERTQKWGGPSLEKEALAPSPRLCHPSPCGRIRPGDGAESATKGWLVCPVVVVSASGALSSHSQRERGLLCGGV